MESGTEGSKIEIGAIVLNRVSYASAWKFNLWSQSVSSTIVLPYRSPKNINTPPPLPKIVSRLYGVL